MLAIVLPTLAATVAFAWWFRAANTRATYLPDFAYSGRLELIVWAIPLLVIMLLGGVAWIGAHDLDPAKPLASGTPPLEIQGVSLDWKWLFIYPNQGIASVNQLVVPAGVPIHFSLTSASVMNAFFIPQLGSMIYTMNGMTTQLNLRADTPGTFHGLSSHYSGDGFSDMHFDVRALPPEQFTAWIEATRKAGPTLDRAQLRRPGAAEHERGSVHLPSSRSRAVPADRHAATAARAWTAIRATRRRLYPRGRSISMLGKLTWAAIPFDQPIPLFAAALVGAVIIAVLAWVTLKGWLPYLWQEWITSVDHKRIGIMYMLLGHGHAAARFYRCDHDAVATGVGVPLAGLPAARALRPDLLGPRHADDLLCRHAVHDRTDELRDAAAAWHPRRGFPDAELGQPLAHRHRCAAGQRFAGRRRIRAHRLAAVSAAVRDHLFARRRRRLLSLVAADLRRRHPADRRQLRHHGPEDPCPRHDLYADAGVLLDDARLQPADRRRLSRADGDLGHAAAGSLPRLSLLHRHGPAAT